MKHYNVEELKLRTTIEHKCDETLVIKKFKNKKLPPFRCIGDGRIYEGNTMIDGKNKKIVEQTVDLIKCVAEMTADEKICFMSIYEKYLSDYEFVEVSDNIWKCKFNYQQKISFDDRTKQKRFLNGFKSLNKKGLVKRVRRGVYVISPYAIIDTNGFQHENERLWESN